MFRLTIEGVLYGLKKKLLTSGSLSITLVGSKFKSELRSLSFNKTSADPINELISCSLFVVLLLLLLLFDVFEGVFDCDEFCDVLPTPLLLLKLFDEDSLCDELTLGGPPGVNG